MKSRNFSIVSISFALFISACSESNFSGDSGQAIRSNKTTTPGTNTPGTNTPGTNTTPDTNGITTDDGGIVQIVEKTLTINSNEDGAEFKNCVNASVKNVSAEQKQLGCNRVATKGARLTRQSATLKIQTNTCNILSLVLESTNYNGQVMTYSTTTTPQRFIIKRTGPNSFNIWANDNNDNDWHDLDLDVIGDGSFKFTIEGAGGCS